MRRRRRRSDREGEAAFYLVVAVIAIFSLVFYWKVFLLITAIAAVLFLILYLNKPPVPIVGIDPGDESMIDPIERQRAFRIATKQKGEEFESYVADHYRMNGYDVIEHGKLYGRKDQGIDLIATSENETLLIQCKNWSAAGKYLITHANIKEFIGNAAVFLEKKSLYADRPVRRLFVTSENVLDQSAIKYIRNNTGIVEHRIISMP